MGYCKIVGFLTLFRLEQPPFGVYLAVFPVETKKARSMAG